MGESMLQRRIVELLRPLLEWWLNVRKGVRAFVGADQFIFWRQYDPFATVAPDVYVIPGVDPNLQPKSWKLWLDKVVPSLAIELVSDEWEKDYREAPSKYDELGVGELVIFDPDWEAHEERLRWQVFRRVGKRGLVRVEITHKDRVRLRSVRCWLRVVGEGREQRLRLGEGASGEILVPTAEERAAEAQQREQEAQQREQEAQQREQEAQQREQKAQQREREARQREQEAKQREQAERAVTEAALERVKELELELLRLAKQTLQ